MVRCFKCGVGMDRVRLFDVISGDGIVKVCKECFSKERLPLVKRPTTFQIKEAETLEKANKSVYERLSQMSGFDKKTINDIKKTNMSGDLGRQETTLKEIVDRNLKRTSKEKSRLTDSLIDNFHWIIMRMRRSKKLNQAQFAKEIAESETAVKMLEQGILPQDGYRIITKLENFLNVNLTKRPLDSEEFQKEKVLDFDASTARNLTISDLKEMKSKGLSQKDLEVPKPIKEEGSSYVSEEFIDLEEQDKENGFSEDEDDDLIWGK
ncbi:MAG: hypothetical protein KKF48_00840 [Nanoarchaeota archaeon]|nr:hypothetical protein [Nanoarchaeota archaeon]MBU1027569.1 hypothetical protein [Nanoarchaeota archaeon]